MSLDNLGEYTNRGTETATATVTAEPPPAQAQPPPAPAPQQIETPPVLRPTPEPKIEVTPTPKETFMSDLVKSFEKASEAPPETPPEPPQKPTQEPTPEPKAEIPPEPKGDRYGLPKVPEGLSDRGRRNWANFEKKAMDQIEAREKTIRDLQGQISDKDKSHSGQAEEFTHLKEQLANAHKVLEQTAIERSPLYKEKILDQQEMVRSRLGKIIEGTSLNPNDINRLIGGDLAGREEVLETHTLSSYRKSQVIDLLEKWDRVEEEKNSMLANGRQSYEQHLRKLQGEEEARRAQFTRESEQHFENEMVNFAPTLEPYQKVEGNQQWNNTVDMLKTNARKIFTGNIDKQALAQTAILAPAAVVYSKFIVPELTKRIRELEAQVTRMKGISPTVSDRGGDRAEPAAPSTLNGDFVKALVDRYRKEVGT